MVPDSSWPVILLALLPVLINDGIRVKNYQKIREFIMMPLRTTNYQMLLSTHQCKVLPNLAQKNTLTSIKCGHKFREMIDFIGLQALSSIIVILFGKGHKLQAYLLNDAIFLEIEKLFQDNCRKNLFDGSFGR